MYKCPIFKVADLIGKRWTIVVIQEIALNGEKGFNAIIRRMGKISPKLLTARLRELERSGLVTRKVLTDSIPLRTSYALTEKGQELNGIITELRRWQAKHSPNIAGCERRECVKCSLY